MVDGPNGWDGKTGYGAGEAGKPAFVVVTSSPPASVQLTDFDWTFVTTGLPDAVTAAHERAEAAPSDSGKELDVVPMGGGATIGSALDAGLVDTLSLHLAPVVLGAGTPLFTGRAPRMLVPAEHDLDIDRDAPDLRPPVTTTSRNGESRMSSVSRLVFGDASRA